ncbi:hypothetical protein ACO0R3_003885 [Hanseniaspora guilliermondii]
MSNNNSNNISLLTKQQQHYILMQQQQINRRKSSIFNTNNRHQSIVVPPTRIAGPNLNNYQEGDLTHNPNDSSNYQNEYINMFKYQNNDIPMTFNQSPFQKDSHQGRKFSLQYVPKTAPNLSSNQYDSTNNKLNSLSPGQGSMGPPSLKNNKQFVNKPSQNINNYRRSSIQPFMKLNSNQSFRNVNFNPQSTNMDINSDYMTSHVNNNFDEISWNKQFMSNDFMPDSLDIDEMIDPMDKSTSKNNVRKHSRLDLSLKKFKKFDEDQLLLIIENNIRLEDDPLYKKTTLVNDTFKNFSSNYSYQINTSNPKRLLVKPSQPNINVNPYNCDNDNGDHIIHVGDIIGVYDPNERNLTKYKSTPAVTSRNGFKIIDLLGKGTYGQVLKCENLSDGKIVAIKMIKAAEECMIPSFMECKVLQRIQSILSNTKDNYNEDNKFIEFIEEFIYKGHLCIVSELLGPSILELLQSSKFHGLNWDLIISFSSQMFASLKELKLASIIHCDLKPENILLKLPISTTSNNQSIIENNSLKIIDFGASCFENATVYTYIQSRFYRAPEVVLGLPYNSGIDMWSVGCVISELYMGIPLFPGRSEYDLIRRIVGMNINDNMPPRWMLDRSKFSTLFFHFDPEQLQYTRLKTIDEYNIDLTEWKACNNDIIIHHLGYPRELEKPRKEYHKYGDDFRKLIMLHRFHKLMHLTDIEKVEILKKRWIFMKFLKKCLTIDPFQRYTPTEALRDPFITGKWINNHKFYEDEEFMEFLENEKNNIFEKSESPKKSQTNERCEELGNLQL